MFFKKKRRSIFEHKKYKLYQSLHYRHNPFIFQKGLFKNKLFKIVNLILILGILSCLYFFIFSDFYNITNIEISGNQIISTDDILDIANNYLAKNILLVLKNKNIFLFNRNAFKKKLVEYVLLDNIKIEKILPNTIRLSIKEKDAALKWLANDQEYLVDKQGLIIKRFYKLTTPKIFQIIPTPENNNSTQEDNFIKIKNLANNPVNLGDKVLNPENTDFILNLQAKLGEKDYLKLKSYAVPNNFPQFLIIELENGALIYFNLADTIENQINRLDLLINQKINKNNLAKVEYIDLRLGESVYYKMK